MDHSSAKFLLAVDVGNSAVKLGRFSLPLADAIPEPTDVLSLDVRSLDLAALQRWLPPSTTVCYLSSVQRRMAAETEHWLRQQSTVCGVFLLSHTDFPIKVRVDHPGRVGSDRLAGATAAARIKPPALPAIIVDAGSAITVDAVSRAGDFLGGAILPGMQTSAQALSIATDLLPLLPTATWDRPPAVVGRSTEAAMQSGLYWGAVGAIRQLVSRMKRRVGTDALLLLTGGGMRQLAKHLAPREAFHPHLVLTGIAIAARSHESSMAASSP